MFHVRQSRREFVPGVHRANARRRGAQKGPGRAGAETVLLPSDDPLPRGTHRRGLAVRLNDLAASRRHRGEGFLGLHSFERFRRVRGVAWFERGDQRVFPLTGNPTSLGCWRLRFKSGRTHYHPVRNLHLFMRRFPSRGSGPGGPPSPKRSPDRAQRTARFSFRTPNTNTATAIAITNAMAPRSTGGSSPKIVGAKPALD